MPIHKGKQRSISQKIDDKPEYLLGAWATDRGLSANLVFKDYGLDFVCQILSPVSGSRAEEVHGAILAVQVSGTEGASRLRQNLKNFSIATSGA